MLDKIEKIEDEYVQIINLIQTLDDAINYADNKCKNSPHLVTISNLICEKSQENFDRINDLSCEMTFYEYNKKI